MVGLLDGIVTKFNASLLASIAGGIHAGEAPEGTATPFCVFHVVTPGFDQAYSGSASATTEAVSVQFDVIGVGYRATGVLCESLASSLRAGVTATSGTNHHAAQVTACRPDPEPAGRDASQRDVWRWSVSIEFGLS